MPATNQADGDHRRYHAMRVDIVDTNGLGQQRHQTSREVSLVDRGSGFDDRQGKP
ncbi:MAG: hypothetical protein K2X56_17780 [Mycobacterium pseudokansasii]|uniref:hypothetical protein n=1 Tax=Mycobacterium pseudokansasii TaxID=2341080 RepID=UPI00142E1267|nr:hypothetical protein [Mycobacterium pseudokansasii]MBY0389895.1 hypothetical protein [Mycobacterium pseudokansasii]